MRNILPIFGRSPFKPFQTHIEKVRETLAHVEPFFEAFLAGDREAARAARKRIMKLEHEADLLKNDIRDHLPRSLSSLVQCTPSSPAAATPAPATPPTMLCVVGCESSGTLSRPGSSRCRSRS